MARPRKNNADYFSHDNNMRNDPKIKSVRAKFGNEGYAVWCMLLELLSEKNGFKLALQKDIEWVLTSSDFFVETKTFKEMIKFFIFLGLIKRKQNFIFCPKLVERLSPLLEKREKMRVMDAETLVSEAETLVSEAEMPHSKVKESKVNISKDIKECVFSKTKSGKPTGITTGDKYTPDHSNPLDTLKARRALERALGIKSSNEFGSFIFGCGWDFLKAFEKTQGRKYIHNVILDQVAKELALWHKAGETRETVRPIISAFMFSSKAGAVTITPTSVFSPHTYETYKQKKLIPPKETAKKEWWQ